MKHQNKVQRRHGLSPSCPGLMFSICFNKVLYGRCLCARLWADSSQQRQPSTFLWPPRCSSAWNGIRKRRMLFMMVLINFHWWNRPRLQLIWNPNQQGRGDESSNVCAHVIELGLTLTNFTDAVVSLAADAVNKQWPEHHADRGLLTSSAHLYITNYTCFSCHGNQSLEVKSSTICMISAVEFRYLTTNKDCVMFENLGNKVVRTFVFTNVDFGWNHNSHWAQM